MRTGLPLLEVRGGPREVGRQHGRAARGRVAHNVALYLRRFELEGGIDRAEIRRRAEAYRQVIERENPAYAEEMAGIAEGAGVDPLDVVAVNVRYEILYTEFVRKGLEHPLERVPEVGGCTSFAILPELSANGHLLVGQNWDWIPDVQGLAVHARRDGLPASLGFTEAGIAGAKIGLNDAGLGLAINGLVSDRDTWSRLKKPFHVRCWEVLASRTLDDALRAVAGSPRSCSSNFLIAKAGTSSPEVVDLELAPDTERRLAPEGGFLCHANHFLDTDPLGIRQPLGQDRVSTFHRYARMTSLLRSFSDRGRKVGVDHLKRILRDHTNAPNSLCRHPMMERPELERYGTVASAILDVDAAEMWLAPGPPCESRFRRIRLAS